MFDGVEHGTDLGLGEARVLLEVALHVLREGLQTREDDRVRKTVRNGERRG